MNIVTVGDDAKNCLGESAAYSVFASKRFAFIDVWALVGRSVLLVGVLMSKVSGEITALICSRLGGWLSFWWQS